MMKNEKYPATNVHPSECGKTEITKTDQYKIDAVVSKMKNSAECAELIYQFTIGIS